MRSVVWSNTRGDDPQDDGEGLRPSKLEEAINAMYGEKYFTTGGDLENQGEHEDIVIYFG